GFTMVELLLVLFIITLMLGVAVPAFAKLSKTTRVEQAARIVLTALYRARSEAQRYRQAVAVYYGDDQTQLNPQPVAGVLPPKERVEIWTARTSGYGWAGEGILGGFSQPYAPDITSYFPPQSYPYRFPDRLLTPVPF